MPDIEDLIKKAVADGQFNDLAGKGKPLNLDENPFVDPEWRMAHHVIKSGGFTLPWIEKRQMILNEIEIAHADLRRSWEWHTRALESGQPASEVDPEWRRAIEKFRRQIQEINKKIQTYNLETPSSRFQLTPLNSQDAIAGLGIS